jgi:hypothetical protein
MIDLEYGRERMLDDIGAAEGIPAICSTAALTAPEFVGSDQARVIVKGRERDEILPALEAALSARFADVAPQMLYRDLLSPLKKAVGNAYKRGNQMDPDKWITVEVIVTRRGAFIEVSDEGAGFDVPGTIAKIRAGEKYYSHGGSGFRRFAKADSVISFANGGRTFRACFVATLL